MIGAHMERQKEATAGPASSAASPGVRSKIQRRGRQGNRPSARLAAHPWQTSTGTRPCGVAGVSRNQSYPLLPLLALSGLDATSRAFESPHEREW